ncbi:lyase family protein [Rhizobium sp. 007]|nr:lyase family protein [Rhizobium sp. 007]
MQAGRTHGQHALPMTFGFKVTAGSKRSAAIVNV